MLLKYFYDSALAHASYMVGCQKTGEAVIIDAGRDVQRYLDAASAEGMSIVAAADTHIHADYVSGALELAHQCGARLLLSDAGPQEWKYGFLDDHRSQSLRDADSFRIGKIEFEVLHTPGHTPESLSFLLTDRGGGANKPMGIFTGDFVFVGSIGRPDLLEQAIGARGTAAAGAKDLYHSVQKFQQLPDYLQVWPAHGSGSACGKGLGAIPSSTVGYEKLFNPALQFREEQSFVDYVLQEQPEVPTYFALMKRVNKEGPVLQDTLAALEKFSPQSLPDLASKHMVVDTRKQDFYAAGHAKGTVNIPLKYLGAWAGWLVEYEQPVCVLAKGADLEESLRILRKIGIDRVAGYLSAEEVEARGLHDSRLKQVTALEIAPQVESGEVVMVDVRGDSEWKEMYIPQAQRCFLGRLRQKLAEHSGDCPVVFQCRSGGRSAIAASLAQSMGIGHVMNLRGGIADWAKAGLPTASSSTAVHGPHTDASACEAALQGQAVFWSAKCTD